MFAGCAVAASGALAGRISEAKNVMARVREVDPALRVSNLKELFPINRPEHFVRWAEGLSKAGLPD